MPRTRAALLLLFAGCRGACALPGDEPLAVAACGKKITWPAPPASQAPFPKNLVDTTGLAANGLSFSWQGKNFDLPPVDAAAAAKIFEKAGPVPLAGAAPLCKVTGSGDESLSLQIGGVGIHASVPSAEPRALYFAVPGLALAAKAPLRISATRFVGHACVRVSKYLPFESCGSNQPAGAQTSLFGAAFPARASADSASIECRGLLPEARDAAVTEALAGVEAALGAVCKDLSTVGGEASPAPLRAAVSAAAGWVGWADPRVQAAKARYDEILASWLDAMRAKAPAAGAPLALAGHPTLTLGGPLRCGPEITKQAPPSPWDHLAWCAFDVTLAAPAGKEPRTIELREGGLRDALAANLDLELVLADGSTARPGAFATPGHEGSEKVDLAGKTLAVTWYVQVPKAEADPARRPVLRVKGSSYGFLALPKP